MQAQFICLAHNLVVLMEQRMAIEHGLRNQKEIKRCEKREKIAEQRAQDSGNRLKYSDSYLG